MIKLLINKSQPAIYFNTFKDLSLWIMEQNKLWRFDVLTPAQIKSRFESCKIKYLTSAETIALENNSWLVEVVRGDPYKVRQIPNISLDMEQLREQWCLDYCRLHQFYIMERVFPKKPDYKPANAFLKMVNHIKQKRNKDKLAPGCSFVKKA